MEHVLGTPELLHRIFNLLNLASNAVNARVCQQWFDIALEILWRNVDNPYFLFKILAPLEESGGSGRNYEFQRLPSSSDWKRFWKYGTQVRCLSFRKDSPKSLLGSVLENIATTRTTLNILPNLHTLVVEDQAPKFCNLCVIFMHTNIKSLTLTLSNVNRTPEFLFEEILVRTPNLTDINIRSFIPMRRIEAKAISLISALLKLKTISLPRFYLTTRLAEALSRLPDLTNIQIGQAGGCGDPSDVMPFAPDLTSDSFPNLLDFSMVATFHNATHFLEKHFSPTNLERLYIESNIKEAGPSIHSLVSAISVISQNCLNLKIICLVSYASEDSRSADVTQFGDLTIDVLRPLFKLSGLVDVQLLHHHPLALKQHDMELLASSWPLLTTLKLNHYPIHHTNPSSLTLEALVPFAKCCPNLTCLGLFVDASNQMFPPVDLIPFQNLETLSLGISGISEAENVALYLSAILPPKSTLCFTPPWNNIPDVFLGRRSSQFRKQWEKVVELLHVLQTARLHERARSARNQHFLLQQSGILPESITINEI